MSVVYQYRPQLGVKVCIYYNSILFYYNYSVIYLTHHHLVKISLLRD